MVSDDTERRLAAIFAADLEGYSRLMGVDEAGTLRDLMRRRALLDGLITSHRGRIANTAGDSVLAEFGSAVDAVQCAIEAQGALAAANAGLPSDRHLNFRIGVHVGDVMVKGGDLFGDGVNITARLQTLAGAGGICISALAHDQVRKILPFRFADLGTRRFKNIEEAIRVFAISPQMIAEGSHISRGRITPPTTRRVLYIVALGTICSLTVGSIAVWHQYRYAPRLSVRANVTLPEVSAAQHPSIAVLPLVSLAASSQDDYFADGLTEDIISALSRFSEISVRSRNSVFAYRGQAPRPEDVGRDLKVRYVVEGSVRKSIEHVRISVRLTDTTNGKLLWSEQYDPVPKDIFAMQEEIARRITGTLAVRVSTLEVSRAVARPPSNLEAYDLLLRARSLYAQGSRTALSQARTLFEKAIEIDPNYVPAYIGLGLADLVAITEGWTSNPTDAVQRAEALAMKSISMDEANASAHALMGRVHLRRGNYDGALDELKRAVALNPSDADSYDGLGSVLLFSGDFDDAIKAIVLSSELQPNLSVTTFFNLGTAQLLSGRVTEAVRTFERSVERYPSIPFSNAMLAAAYAAAGRRDAAARQAAVVREKFPNFTSHDFGSQFRNPEDREKLSAALKEVGL